MLIDIKMKKKSGAELGHNGRLKIYVEAKKKLRRPRHLSPFTKMAKYIWLKFRMEY